MPGLNNNCLFYGITYLLFPHLREGFQSGLNPSQAVEYRVTELRLIASEILVIQKERMNLLCSR